MATSAEEIAGPTHYCNWVIKGRLIAGAYPGLRTEKEQHDVIQKILQAGIHFIARYLCV